MRYLPAHNHRTDPNPSDVRFDAFRGAGPGGQKRNKTSSAVRATHTPTGLSATSDTTRSQHENKAAALLQLRHLLTVECRKLTYLDRPDPPGDFSPRDLGLSARSPRYLQTLGHALDTLHAAGYVLSVAAQHLGTTTGQLSSFLTQDDLALPYINRQRTEVGLKPLSRR
jgi:hypothetical protein